MVKTINISKVRLFSRTMEKVILIPRNKVFPEAILIDPKLLEEYREGVSSYSESARKSLDIFFEMNEEIVGSNCFAPIELRKYLPKEKRLATMSDLGRAKEINPRFISNSYSDVGLVLRKEDDLKYPYNTYLARGLINQLSKRSISLKTPKVIYFDALDLKEDKDSLYGLAYILNEKAKFGENIVDAPELTRNYQFKIFDEKGIPIIDERGSRSLHARQDGLSRFYLYKNSAVGSGNWDLSYSNYNGRVVLVDDKGTD